MIKVLIGSSGCGKSTLAKNIATDNTIILSRDKAREMLFGYTEKSVHKYYEKENLKDCEKTVTDFINRNIEQYLDKGYDIILDNTHLKIEYLNQIIRRFFYTNISFVDVPKTMNTTLHDCIENDKKRTRQVGEKVIRNQWKEYETLCKSFDFKSYAYNPKPIIQNPILPESVIFDIDGTLAYKGERSAYDWKSVGNDSLNNYVANVLFALKEEYKIIICSGRDSICRKKTIKWLKFHNIPYELLLMRPQGSYLPDWKVKESMWRELVKKYYITCMFDDRNQVVNHARRFGFKVMQVNKGDF